MVGDEDPLHPPRRRADLPGRVRAAGSHAPFVVQQNQPDGKRGPSSPPADSATGKGVAPNPTAGSRKSSCSASPS